MFLRKLVGIAIVASAGVAALATGAASAQIKIGVIVSATGPTALVGIPQRNTVPLLPKTMGGQPVEYTVLDDGSDTTASVTAVRKLISEQNIDVLIGPSGTPNAMAVLQFIAESGVPMMSPTGGASVVLPMNDQKKWVFKTTQNDDIIAAALVDHMVKVGVKTVGLIGTADPFGENWAKVFGELSAAKGIKVVASEKFNRSDTSVTGQSLKILAARPDAVLVTAPGGPSVLPHITLIDQGYKGRMYQTHGAALPDFLRLGGKKVEGTVLAASLMLVLPEMPDSNPSKKMATSYIEAYKQAHGSVPATFGANVYDAGLLLDRAVPIALQKGKPGTKEFRAALRDALEQTKELVATQGVYNMTPADHSGFDQRGRELITVKDGGWTLLK
ncbi:MAG: ABC transporter substrate-binding protein [Lautropia sp.]